MVSDVSPDQSISKTHGESVGLNVLREKEGIQYWGKKSTLKHLYELCTSRQSKITHGANVGASVGDCIGISSKRNKV